MITVRVGRLSRRHFSALTIGLATVIACSAREIPGYPVSVDAFDPREIAMLPGYCIHTELFRSKIPGGSNPEMIQAWTRQMGEVFRHMHHYCFGLMKTHRALLLSRDSGTRRFYLADSLIEFDYVIDRAPESFVLLPEILTKKGEALVHLGMGPVAVVHFERAIGLKLDYWPPYAQLSDYYKASGDTRKARRLLEEGLSHVPDAKALQRRIAELDTTPRWSSTAH